MLFEFETGGGVVAAAEGGDGAADIAKHAEVSRGGGRFDGAAADDAGVTEEEGEVHGDEPGDVIGEGAEGGFHVGGIGGDFAEGGEEFLAGVPVAEAAVTPVAEVLPVDGAGVEAFREDGLDLLEGIEPREDDATGVVLREAAV